MSPPTTTLVLSLSKDVLLRTADNARNLGLSLNLSFDRLRTRSVVSERAAVCLRSLA